MGKNTLNSHIKHFWLDPQQAFLLKKKAFNLTGMYGIAYSWNTINSDFFPEKIKNNSPSTWPIQQDIWKFFQHLYH